jgi:uncharacterized membrane protein
MLKNFFTMSLLAVIFFPSAVFACSSDKSGVITGGACSIAEINSKINQKKAEQSIMKTEKQMNTEKRIISEKFITPSQKIICKYSSLCPVYFKK